MYMENNCPLSKIVLAFEFLTLRRGACNFFNDTHNTTTTAYTLYIGLFKGIRFCAALYSDGLLAFNFYFNKKKIVVVVHAALTSRPT